MTDAFNVAFRIPNLFRRLFAEGAFSQAFVPVLAATKEREGEEATRLLVDRVASLLVWALLLTCVLGVGGAPVLVWLMASGLQQSPRGFEAAVFMTRWMFPYIGFMSLVALSAGVLNTFKRFAVPAATPVLLNVCMIAAAWLGAPWLKTQGIEPIYALGAGVMLGGLLQLAVQIPALLRLGMLPQFSLGLGGLRAAWGDAGTRSILRLMLPALLGVALGVVLMPQLAASRAANDNDKYSAMLDWGLRLVVLLAVPSAVALLTFAQPLVATLYHYGAFTDGDVLQTTRALMGYGLGLLGLVAIKVLAPGFYANQDIRTPVRIAIVVLVLTQLMNLVLVPYLQHAGLALAIGIGALINAGWLLVGLIRRGSYRPLPGWGRFGLQVALASALLAVFLLWAAQALSWTGMRSLYGQRIGLLLLVLLVSALLYFATLRATGLRVRSLLGR
jgi:putative peptidoglycan lipid II flippase